MIRSSLRFVGVCTICFFLYRGSHYIPVWANRVGLSKYFSLFSGEKPPKPINNYLLSAKNVNRYAAQWEKYEELLGEAAKSHRLHPALLKAVILVESRFNPAARSPQGAQGLMQLMPDTARFLGVKRPFDPKENIGGGARYLRTLLDQFDGNLSLALAGYNAGPGLVRYYGTIPPFSETQNYVRLVTGVYAILLEQEKLSKTERRS